MNENLPVTTQHNGNAVITFSDMEKMAVVMSNSKMFGAKTKEQFLCLMMIASAEGKHPAIAAREYDIINNTPALKSQFALARYQQSGGKIEYLERTEKVVRAKFTHPNSGTIEISWDIERARKMEYLSKDNWKKQPMIMLQWRCIAEGVRASYPACLGGNYLDMEVMDFTEPVKGAVPVKYEITGDDKEPVRQIPTDTSAQEPPPPTENTDSSYEHGDVPPTDMETPASSQPDFKTISPAQAKRLYAIAKSVGKWSDNGIKKVLADKGWGRTTEILSSEYDSMIESFKLPAPEQWKISASNK